VRDEAYNPTMMHTVRVPSGIVYHARDLGTSTDRLSPAGILQGWGVKGTSPAGARSGSNWPGGAPCGVGDPENRLELVKPGGRDGLVRVPGVKVANWSSGGRMWTEDCPQAAP
jgi:hypothetical protein